MRSEEAKKDEQPANNAAAMSEASFQAIFTTCYIIRNFLSESFSIVEDPEWYLVLS